MGDVVDRVREGDGNLLEKKDPARVAQVLRMKADGCSMREVYDATGTSFEQQIRLYRTHGDTIHELHKEIAMTAGQVAKLSMEMLTEKLQQINNNPDQMREVQIRDIALVTGIAVDKSIAANTGGVTVIEHRSGPSIDDAMAYQEGLRKKLADRMREKATDAEIIETNA